MALATKPKPKAHHRKRQAQHHKQSKHYVKAYWPYLPMLALVAVSLAINTVWSSGSVLGTQTDFTSMTLLSETNEERQTKGLPELTLDPQLMQAAQAKAEDMAQKNYWDHTSPLGATGQSFIAASGYQYQQAGENLAYGFSSANDTLIGWMNSPSHRANILNPNYQHVGFGVATSPDFQTKGPQVVIVAEYGQPIEAGAGNLSFSVPDTADNTQATSFNQIDASRPVARIELLSGTNGQLILAATLATTATVFAFLLLRHGRRLHKLAIRGEHFIARHPFLDIAAILIIATGVWLTRSAGHIN